MNKHFFAFLLLALMLAACEKATDVPSLDEKMEGRWTVDSYTEERYDWNNQVILRKDVACTGKDYMEFSTFNQLQVNFDSVGTSLWTYQVFDARTLVIEGKQWAIDKLDEHRFELSL